MKRCPYCAEEIQDAAILCRFCGRALDAGAPDGAAPTPVPSAPIVPPAVAPATVQRAAGPAPGAVLPPFALARGLSLKAALALAGIGLVLPAFGWPVLGYLTSAAAVALLVRTSCVLRAPLAAFAAACMLIPGAVVHNAWKVNRAEAVKREAQEAQLARLPALEQELQKRIGEGKWAEAKQLLGVIKSTDGKRPGLAEAGQQIQAGLAQQEVGRKEVERRVKLAAGLAAAEKVVKNKGLCDTPKAIADAWNGVSLVRREDTQWSAAVSAAAGLERCRKSSEASFSRGLQKLMVQQREQWAKRSEISMLDQGMNVDFVLAGAQKDRVTLRWALMSKAAVHKITGGGSMQQGAFLAQLQKVGFRRVSFSDGYDFGVYYDLEPSDESSGGAGVMQSLGLGKPLVLK